MFGGQGTGGGFNFTPTASSTGNAPATGFSFGAPNTTGTSGAPTTGFSFGAPAATTAAATAPGAGGGFSFGGIGNAAGSTGGGLGGFGLLGSAPASTITTAAPATGGLSGFNVGATAGSKPTTMATGGAPAAGFNLGTSTTTAAAAPAAGTGFNFGGGTGSSGFTGLGGNVSANAKTTTLPGVTPAASTAPGGINFGSTAAKSTAAAAPLLGGLLNSTQPSTLSIASTTAAPAGFSLGGTSTGGTAAPTGFSFGPPSVSQPPSTAATTAATSLGGGLGLSGFAATTSTTTSVAGTTTTAPGAGLSLPGGQKQMTFRQLEDTINKWTTELEEQEKCFLDQATQVNAWDRIVMENGEKIIQLNKDLERVKLDQQKLDHELDFVHSQQRELEELLTPLESALDELPPISHTQHAQLEREHTYTLAESLDSQLKRMSQDLKEIVERLNSTNIKPDDNDPLQQITKILNAHVVSLMWVDRNSSNLQRRAEEIAKMMDLEKKEQERNFRMAYS